MRKIRFEKLPNGWEKIFLLKRGTRMWVKEGYRNFYIFTFRFKVSESLDDKNFPARHLKLKTLTPKCLPNLMHLATVDLIDENQHSNDSYNRR